METHHVAFGRITISVLLSLFLVLNNADIFLAEALGESKVYIVYLGERQHDDLDLITSGHHELLSSVLGSKEESAEKMVYSYKHGFSGFAAKITPSQAHQLKKAPGVLHVIPNHIHKLHTTRSWDYLGLSPSNIANLLNSSRMGEDAIIGVVDSGVWPENKAFHDEGLGPIPSKWKGFCEEGAGFDAKTNCNKKLIGARYFVNGFLAELGVDKKTLNITDFPDLLSPRDLYGHGTHTASTAGGGFVHKASGNGLAPGTLRGGAPRARVAIYKVAWLGEAAVYADLLKAFDEAIHDGVDVLSLSLGMSIPLYPEIDKRDLIYLGSFHAASKGIVVVTSGGNEGPMSQTVANIAPWAINVAASTIDRSFPTLIALGNNKTMFGQALYSGHETDFIELAYPETKSFEAHRYCESLSKNDTWMAKKTVLCFTMSSDLGAIGEAISKVKKVHASGLIIAKDPTRVLDLFNDDSFPTVQVDFHTGTEILNYVRSTRSPKARLGSSKTYIGKPVSTYVASFSSRGPNTLAPEILKPDITAPGVNILAAVPPTSPTDAISTYNFKSGTSMSAPHVAGIAALLKSMHPHWSPAAINSALVTTAWVTDPSSGAPIFSEGLTNKVATPFDYGGGLVNPNAAAHPGLVYDMGVKDYIHYLCARGFDDSSINKVTRNPTSCPKPSIPLTDLNVPSITIPSLRGSVTITRTVTNVGRYSTYKATVEPPQGYAVTVKPNSLKFTRKGKSSLSFTVTISTSRGQAAAAGEEYSFGSLVWADGVHRVRIPISVRGFAPEYVG